MNDFGRRLRAIRQSINMTQKQLAGCIYVSKATISNYETGERQPSPEILVDLAKALHVSTDYLLGIEGKKRSLDVSGLTEEEICFLKTAVLLLKKNAS